MLSRDYLREHADEYRATLQNRGASVDLERFLELERDRRAAIYDVEQKKKDRNEISELIAGLKRQKHDATAQVEASKKLGEDIKKIEAGLALLEEALRSLELSFPNIPDKSVPVGADESANRVERTWGDKPSFSFTPKAHWDIGEALGILDFERATKVTGARFAFLFAGAAKLSRALMNLMLDVHE